MKNCRFSQVVVASLLMGLATLSFAADAPAEMQRDRLRAAEALKEKDPQRAVKLVEPWVKKRPDDIELANDYALALAQQGKLDQAREVLEEALSRNRESGLAFQNLREILSQQAAISYAKAMNRKPPSAQVALKSGASLKEPPVVVAQVEPRPGASVEIAPPRSPAVNGSPEGRANAAADKALKSSAKGAAVPSATPETSAKVAAAKSEGTSDEAALSAALRGWADAWSEKDFKRYLAVYSEKFQPQQFPSREAWAAYRKPRVTRPDPISVKVSEIRIKLQSPDRAEVTFRQRYEAGGTKLNSVKTTLWVKESDGWKILREEGR
ncbi:MAG: tetratricopeptide repeat protein [Burkholderiaceae bacterium]|nr:tetratricopeptide repeat protein [Burkholderiaceae bacterium]